MSCRRKLHDLTTHRRAMCWAHADYGLGLVGTVHTCESGEDAAKHERKNNEYASNLPDAETG